MVLNSILDEASGIVKENEEKFFNTETFEVYCTCPLKNSEYFLVGGFDNSRREGKIRLYKIIYDEISKASGIEYLQDIQIDECDEFKGFNLPVNCIIQSTIDDNLLISCMDGHIYLFSNPNLSFYTKGKVWIYHFNIFTSNLI